MLESYVKKVQIEARVMGDLATTVIIPAAVKYQNILLENIKGLKDAGLPESAYKSQKEIVTKISEHISMISEKVESMIDARKKANEITDSRAVAIAYCDEVKEKHFDIIRYHVDKLELIVDDAFWMLPKYREILFLR
jgi:glutamine synthetase